jgi:predicted DNA-binding protein (MmcQ/YjbR family)
MAMDQTVDMPAGGPAATDGHLPRLAGGRADDGHPPHRSFLVGKKSFAWYVENEHGDGRIAVIVRAPPGENAEVVAADAERFTLPKYVARHGWVSYYLDLVGRPADWGEVRELVSDSYRIQAPRRLARLLD